MSEERLVPKLRFSGFDDEWVSYKIGDISKTYSGGTPSTSKREYYKGNIPFIKSGEIGNEVTEQYINEEAINNSSAKKVQKGDLLLALYGATSGEVAISKIDGAINQAVLKIDNKMNNYFQYNYFVKYKDQIIHKYLQGGQGNLSANIIKKLEFYYPNLEEQQKISNYLLLIDNKIELLEKKHHEYQNFKKYLMQQIFTQKLRFDFNDEWRIRILNEITFYQEGPGVRNYQYTKEGVKLLNVGNFVNNALELDNTDKYISNEEAYGKYKHFLVDEGDLLIACSGIKAEYFDEKIAFAENKHLPLCMNTSTMRFKSLDENTLNLRYLKYYFQTQSFKKQVFQVMTGSAQFNFGPTHLKYFKIPIPCLDEQIKIYQMFESIDIKILNIYREIMKVKEFKKGLLQQMFDNMLLFKL